MDTQARQRAAGYIRVSTAEQSDGVSLEMQRRRCEQHASAQGWRLDVYTDVESGRKADRAQLSLLRQRLQRYDALLCWRLDRASRSVSDCLHLLEECDEANCQLISLTEGFDSTTPLGQAMVAIVSAFAQLESDTIGQRVRAAQQHQLETGRIPWRACYGYARDAEGRAQVHPEEAAVVCRIFEERAGGSTQREITEGLQAEGIKRRGSPWRRSGVAALLANPAYIGQPWVDRWQTVRGRKCWKPIAEWRQANGLLPRIVPQKLWESAGRCALRGRRPSYPALCRGLLICGECEYPLYVRSWKRRADYGVAYVCEGWRRHWGCRTGRQITEEVLHELLGREVTSARVDLPNHHDASEAFGKAHERLERAKQLFMDGLVGHEEVKAIAAQMKAAEGVVNSRLPREATEQEVRAAVAKIQQILGMQDIEAANRRLRQVVARIVVHQDPPGIEFVLWAS